ncbi:MAG: Fe(3+) ABC transporter substrate-binding protein [Trueperaceae bacterium]
MKKLCLLLLTAMTFVQAQDVVNVYSARHYDSDQALFEGFTAQTGIEVNLIEAKAEELIERVRSSGDNSPADVLITVDAGNLWRADEAGLLEPVTSDVLTSAIPENLRHPEGKWFGLATRARVIIYNKETVTAEELSSYEDLASEAWQGRVCIRSSSNIYNQSLLASIIAAYGEEAAEAWAQGIVNNFAREPEGGDTDQIKAVAAGECDVAVSNHYYLARLLTSEDPAEQDVANAVGIFFPNQDDRGTHINISGAAVVAGAPNRDNAVAFIEYLASSEAQALFAEQGFEYPVVEGVAVSDVIEGFGDFKADTLNVASYGESNPLAVQIMDRVGWK